MEPCIAKEALMRIDENMSFNAKRLAVSAVLLGALAVGAAMPASALGASAAIALPNINWPWQQQVAAESIEPGDYSPAMLVGQTQQLSPVVLPEGATDKLSYASSDESVVAVSNKGVVQALALGTARVTVTAGAVSTSYDITVQTDTSTWVVEMDLTLTASRIIVGDTASVQIQILPTNATNTDQLALTSSDESVATVNSFGKVTGIAPGTATITATCGSVSASANITVLSSETGSTTEAVSLNSSYVVLKPGGTFALKASVSPASASQSMTYKTNDSGVAAVSASGVITATGTGATSIIVSNGTASALVSVIVDRTATAPDSGSGDDTPSDEPTTVDPAIEAIEAADGDEATLAQSVVPVVTSDILNAARLSGKTLVITADDYTIRIDGAEITNTNNELDTAINFESDADGLKFVLNNSAPLPGDIQIEVSGDQLAYRKLYLYNTVSEKWQYLNSYKDGVMTVDTAGDYLLTNSNMDALPVSWVFLIAAAVTGAAIGVVFIAFKKRYWFW